MFVLAPLLEIPTSEKSRRFLELLSKVAVETRRDELGCKAYGWFTNAEPTEAIPGHWLRGFEVFALLPSPPITKNPLLTDSWFRYETPADNREKHRAGQAYKNFREAVLSEGLLPEYPDMRFWCPTGAGFLTRTPVEFKSSGDPSAGYIVIQDLTLDNSAAKAKAVDKLNAFAKSAEASIESFYILERENAKDGDDLIVFARFDSAENYASCRATEAGQAWKAAEAIAKSVRTTQWNESGVGFLGRP
ncbi:unnamed protein product [Clonostachys solani]|uniref:Uncharacterized protein n=1 Tax=Clonostachys solani TaxID=160281 RepID=A0A9P0EMH0_9HYPO|nr:unnamed protein product [Clonostachys solani]